MDYITDGITKWKDVSIKNKYDNSKYRIPLHNKHNIVINYTIVDPEQYDKVSSYKWWSHSGYAVGKPDNTEIRLHHFVFKKPEERHVVDHINGDKLDNRLQNLREVNFSFNSQNREKKQDTSSKYKGVTWNKRDQNYRSQSSKTFLGSFVNELDAAIQYDIYTYQMYGKFANNNNLISYTDALKKEESKVNTERKLELPKNIYLYHNNKDYAAQITYNNIPYRSNYFNNVFDALAELKNIETKINYKKVIDEYTYLHSPIERNIYNIAIIKCQDTEILVDDDKWHILNTFKWNMKHDGYVQNTKLHKSMHQLVIILSGKHIPNNYVIDHINKQKTDNRLTNLRVVERSINSHNQTKNKNKSSQYIGVCKFGKRWEANIHFKHKKFFIGYFDNEIEAALAYNMKATELYKEHANLNLIL
jgi:hypothetical protein